jgi:predicted S18 family serine protease
MANTRSKSVIKREYKQAVENLKEAAAALYGEACLFDLEVLLGMIADKARKGDYS